MTFDFGKIQEVNSIKLQPEEVVVFHIPGATDDEAADFFEWVKKTPLTGKALLVTSREMEITKVQASGEEEE